jgi:hypothetical protein
MSCQNDQKVQLARAGRQLATPPHLVEAFDNAYGSGEADGAHAECAARRREVSSDRANAEYADDFPIEQSRRESFPALLGLRSKRTRQIATERKHRSKYRLRDWHGVQTANSRHHDVRSERGAVDDPVDSGSQRLDPSQARPLLQDVIGHLSPEGHQAVGRLDDPIDLAMVVHHVDLQLGKRFLQPALIPPVRIRWCGQENKRSRHRGFFESEGDDFARRRVEALNDFLADQKVIADRHELGRRSHRRMDPDVHPRCDRHCLIVTNQGALDHFVPL